uniref:Uncharacterized protein n=2 Tax=Physcomitrium patens TaxID=3218 RepID=A0A7I4CJE6_PHYPA
MARALDHSHDDSGASTAVQVAAGEAHSLALAANGSVYTWGRGQFGRMGMGVFQDELEPTLVEIGMIVDEEDIPLARDDRDSAERTRVTQIAAGAYHSLALAVLLLNGNMDGQLGRQRAASYPAPVIFPRLSSSSSDENRENAASWNQGVRDPGAGHLKIVQVEAGGMMSSAIDQDGGLWVWGAVPQPAVLDRVPESDTFEMSNINQPERVLALRGHSVRRIACGSDHILALIDSRNGVDCYAWGGNAFGQLGLGDFEPRVIPTKIMSLLAQQVGVVVDLACGYYHSAIVTVQDDDQGQDPESSSMGRKVQSLPQLMEQAMASPKMRERVPAEHFMESLASPWVRSKQGYPYAPSNNGSRNHSYYSVHSDTSSRAYSQSSMSSRAGNGARPQAPKRESGAAGDGRLSTCWTFGQNENGQLGVGSCTNSHTPVEVEALPTRERIQTVVCGLFHTAVVMESGDVWVWGMEGGLGQCPGIGPPGSKSGDALSPVRVFGESSATCDPVTGSKGIACGAAHTVTVSNGGKDLWTWGRGKNGVLGLGHNSDSWFPSPVLWPPGSRPSNAKELDAEGIYDIRKSSRASSRGGSRGRGDEIRPYVREGDDSKPPRSYSFSRLPVEQYVREVQEVETDRPPRGLSSSRKAAESPGRPSVRVERVIEPPGRPSRRGDQGMQSPTRSSRRGDHFWPPVQPEPENIRSLNRDTGTEPSVTSMRAFKYQIGGDPQTEEDLNALKLELAECRRYAERLHVAVYGGQEMFTLQLPGNSSNNYDSSVEGMKADGLGTKSSALQDWQQHVEDASLEELVKLDRFYKGMRNRLKDIMFQRKMEDWCRRAMSGLPSSYAESPPVREPYSVQSTPYFDGPGEMALRMSGILNDRGEMLPPAALAASLAEFRMHSQRRK